jgi:D-alanyl-D-alanine carboxypeptidase/D-alanyl-D-alanine-endopeptidase (penicillin-binding protein 4)
VVWQIANRGRRLQKATLPVKDPGLHAGHVFHRLARAQGIMLAPPVRATTTPAAGVVVASHESPPLRFLLRNMLVYSNNMMAELIGLSAARRLSNRPVDLGRAGELLIAHLDQLIPEVDWSGAVLGNYSGLDGESRMTARQLAAIARYGWRTQALPALLPAAGWSGTLANRFDDGDAALRVWAKTGTVNYGSALAGYLFPTSDRPAVFVTLVSDTAARAAYDAALKPDRALEQTARAWNKKARKLQDDLVEAWLEPLPTS